jgi:hypothetical protein
MNQSPPFSPDSPELRTGEELSVGRGAKGEGGGDGDGDGDGDTGADVTGVATGEAARGFGGVC